MVFQLNFLGRGDGLWMDIQVNLTYLGRGEIIDGLQTSSLLVPKLPSIIPLDTQTDFAIIDKYQSR